MNAFALTLLKALANLHGSTRRWYLSKLYLPLVRSNGDLGQISLLLTYASRAETRLVLDAMGAKVDQTAYVENHQHIHNAPGDYRNLRIGSGSYIGKDCFLDISGVIDIGPNVTVAMRVTVLTHFDGGRSTAADHYTAGTKSVTIADGAYVGAGAIILPGVAIGSGAMVAAGGVVTHDIPAGMVVAGVPARLIRPLGNNRTMEHP